MAFYACETAPTKTTESTPTTSSAPPNTVAPEAAASPLLVTLNQNGDITLSGKKIEFDSLKPALQRELLKLPSIPTEVPIKYEGEVLMGMRHEMQTVVNEAITGAKEATKK